VTEVAVFPARIELFSGGHWVVIRLAEIAELAELGWLLVADRDWFHDPPDRFFRFYTTPPIVVYMPNEAGVGYPETCFCRIQDVLVLGGFSTFDLG
jgi:hypothetical protein